MILNRVMDPRDKLQHATRAQLYKFAEAHNVEEIINFQGQGNMPKVMMLAILRSKGLTDINVRPRPLGSDVPNVAQNAPADNEVDAVAALAAQINARPSVTNMKMPQLRSECKKRGIKTKRTDSAERLRELLNGEDTSQLSE